ncbi:MAG: FecR domain-containing protein [Thermoflavifilum sp.]|nr:FecR domain-containing protein [Thermoflavifilum sp.]
MASEKKLSKFIRRYLSGRASEKERREVENWYTSFDKLPLEFMDGDEKQLEASEQYSIATIWEKIKQAKAQGKKLEWRKQLHKVAAILLILILLSSGGYLFYLYRHSRSEPIITQQPIQPDFKPGGNKAILQLANGSLISLDSIQQGIVANQGGVQAIQMNTGHLVYQSHATHYRSIVYNTLIAPAGGTYELELADGTKVWLNARSSIRFPTMFAGKEREVEITGEAYFEVAKNPSKPFIVKVKGTTIRVLGTHFNVMAYDEEPTTVQTTLLEGSVQITSADGQKAILSPGQQADIQAHHLQIYNHVNVDEVIAWKNHLFWFDNTDIYSVMRQLARWYDVKIIMKDSIPDLFTGSIPRNLSFSEVIHILQQTGSLHYVVVGQRTVVIMR